MELRVDLDVVSKGSGAKRLILGSSRSAECSSGECFRACLDDFVVVSIGSGAKRRTTFCCGGEDGGMSERRQRGPDVVKGLVEIHARDEVCSHRADQASTEQGRVQDRGPLRGASRWRNGEAERRAARRGGLAGWRTGGLADWRVGGLADWQTDESTEEYSYM